MKEIGETVAAFLIIAAIYAVCSYTCVRMFDTDQASEKVKAHRAEILVGRQ
jgi:hypothetical protein